MRSKILYVDPSMNVSRFILHCVLNRTEIKVVMSKLFSLLRLSVIFCNTSGLVN